MGRVLLPRRLLYKLCLLHPVEGNQIILGSSMNIKAISKISHLIKDQTFCMVWGRALSVRELRLSVKMPD
jgi:hypothetical protein